jgi:hypothetical protein
LQVKNPDPKDPAFDCPLRGFTYSFPLAAVHWSDEALQNIKFQAPNLKVSGVRCRVSGVRCQGRKTKNLKPETVHYCEETGIPKISPNSNLSKIFGQNARMNYQLNGCSVFLAMRSEGGF